MTLYHVWFSLKNGVPEQDGLASVAQLLSSLCTSGQAVDFQLSKNTGQPPRSKLLPYHAVIQFADPTALGAAMKWQTQAGIHSGLHGQMLTSIAEFHVEVFTTLPTSTLATASDARAI
jgi:hypothetical protein